MSKPIAARRNTMLNIPVRENDRSGKRKRSPTRRRLLKAGGAVLLAGTVPAILPSRARAQKKTLKILQWKHFVPSYDEWFNGTYVKQWGEQNDTLVIVDNVGVADIDKVASAEIQAKRGHDLVLFIKPPAEYEDHVIDMREIYEECERKYQKPTDFILKSTYNPRSGIYFGFCSFYLPAVITYQKSWWDRVDAVPASWDDVLRAGRQIKLQFDKPVGISLAPEQNSGQTMRPSCIPSGHRNRTRTAIQS
jgi:multiple sugar transport system substrate-binding protein